VAAETSAQDMDRAAAEREASAQPAREQGITWGAVGVIILIAFAIGGIVGFMGGRIAERERGGVIPPDVYWLLGADIVDRGDAVVLARVTSGGPADIAGLGSGDEVISVDGTRVRSARQARQLIARYAPGDVVWIAARRNFRTRDYVVTLGYFEPIVAPVTVVPPPTPVPVTPPVWSQQQSARLGVYYRMVQPGDPFAVAHGALIVAFLDTGTPAESAGLEPGDIITHVGGRALSDTYTLGDALSGYDAGDRVRLDVNRAGDSFRVTSWLGG
jgi:S1-C subfamily serine protease